MKLSEINTSKENVLTILGNQRTSEYLPLLKDKNVAVIANQTSVINNTHIVDSLLNHHFKIK